MAADTSARTSFFSFSPEIRNMIYRLLFCSPDPIPTDDTSASLSAQLLRTCKEIHTEGASILYGENTFTVEISNTIYPDDASIEYSPVLQQLFGCAKEPPSQAALAHLRSFLISIRQCRVHPVSPLRAPVRGLSDRLRKLSGQIQYLRLECKFDCKKDSEDNPYGYYSMLHRYRVKMKKDKCVGILRTWLGVLDVKKGDIEGMPEDDAGALKDRWGGEGREELLQRMEIFKALEQDIAGDDWEFCKDDFHQALMCFETDDEVGFNERKEGILCEDLKDREESWISSD